MSSRSDSGWTVVDHDRVMPADPPVAVITEAPSALRVEATVQHRAVALIIY